MLELALDVVVRVLTDVVDKLDAAVVVEEETIVPSQIVR